MSDDPEIKVEIEEEAAEDVAVKLEDEKEQPKKEETDAAADLKAQYEEGKKREAEEKERRLVAEQRAAEARSAAEASRREAEAARKEVSDSQLESITSGIEAAKDAAESAKRDARAARELGDYDKEMEALDRLTTARSRVIRLDEAKSDIEARKLEALPPPKQQTWDDPFEQSISKLSDPSKDWLRKHKEWVSDSRKNAQLTAAHYDAVANDVRVDSPEYFEFVEKKIGLRKDPDKVEVQAHVRKKAPPVAPVNGGAGSGMDDSNTVRLTPGEARAATDGTLQWNYPDPTGKGRWKKGDPIGQQEFARRKREGMRQGLYNKSKME